MRIGALVLGLIGALIGFVGGATVAVLGGVAVLNLGEFIAQFGSEENSVAVWRGMLAVLASIVAAGAALLALSHPRVSAIILILSAAAGVYLIGGYYAPAIVFLVPATLFAVRGSFDKKAIGFGRRSSKGGPGPKRRRPAGGGNGKAPAR